MTPLRPAARRTTALALAALLSLGTVTAEARPGSSFGGGFGSRGGRTFSAPAPTPTAPSARPIERSTTQPGPTAPGYAPAAPRPRFGFGGGFFAGLLGAGLLGALMGHGFLGGLAGIASFLGFLFQVGLLVLLGALVVRWFRRRQGEPALAGAGYARGAAPGPAPRLDPRVNARSGSGGGGAVRDGVGIGPTDYEGFERALGAIQAAYSAEDLPALRRLTTSEMASYFTDEISRNAARGVANRIEGVRLLQGDLSEAWREGGTDYATVAMRFALTDTTVERGGRVVATGPSEASEFWTFRRDGGGPWVLSALQQAR